MFEYALEQVPMDIQKLQRGERERLLIQQLGNIGSYSIGLFLFCIVFVMCCFVDIVRLQLFTHIINGNVTFNMPNSRLLQIVGNLQTIHILQTDSRAPYRSPLALMWLCHALVSFEIKILLLMLIHNDIKLLIRNSHIN